MAARTDDWPVRALAAARPAVFWLDDPARPERLAPLAGEEVADLAVVGGGFTGLWAALRAKERRPDLDVVLVEAGGCGEQASGRNGGFASASLTHGFGNGRARWPEELPLLDRLGADNLAAIGATVRAHGIDCAWEEPGELTVATRPHEADELAELAGELAAAGHDARLLDTEKVRAEVDSPTYVAGLFEPDGTALVEPARLAWGLRRACLAAGVRLYEDTPVTGIARDGAGLLVRTHDGRVAQRRVVLGTNAFPPLLRRLRLMTVPVYDYVLVTEPLSAEQRRPSAGATGRASATLPTMFHYYRLTRDDRILWGGYDAVYHYGSRIDAALEQRAATHAAARPSTSSTTFPQLSGLSFTHRWAGVIDTCTRFTAFFGTAYDGRVGLRARLHRPRGGRHPVRRRGAPRPARRRGHRARPGSGWCASRPLPFPPEPLRSAGIAMTRRSLGAGRRQRRSAQPLASWSGPVRARLRLLTPVPPWSGNREGAFGKNMQVMSRVIWLIATKESKNLRAHSAPGLSRVGLFIVGAPAGVGERRDST